SPNITQVSWFNKIIQYTKSTFGHEIVLKSGWTHRNDLSVYDFDPLIFCAETEQVVDCNDRFYPGVSHRDCSSVRSSIHCNTYRPRVPDAFSSLPSSSYSTSTDVVV